MVVVVVAAAAVVVVVAAAAAAVDWEARSEADSAVNLGLRLIGQRDWLCTPSTL